MAEAQYREAEAWCGCEMLQQWFAMRRQCVPVRYASQGGGGMAGPDTVSGGGG